MSRLNMQERLSAYLTATFSGEMKEVAEQRAAANHVRLCL